MIHTLSGRAMIALALIASTVLLVPRSTQACGPFFTDAIFVYTKHPDFPLERFAQGQLGVLQPSYARSYLFAAYRNLIDVGFSESEVSALKSLWEDRLNNAGEVNDDGWIKKWLDARGKVPGLSAPPEIHAFRNREKPHEYESYLNCQQDAFDNAATTLVGRIKQFGADTAGVRSWVSAQDLVLANCSEGKHIPADASAEAPDLPPMLRADRAYQIAAANFYAGNFGEATQEFDAIARDAASPWHEMAGYLAARAMLRKGSFAEKEEDGRPALAEAEARLNAVIKDRSVASSHHAAARLLNLARLRLHPEETLHELAHKIIKKDATADFKQSVWDYTVLFDKFVGDEDDTKKRAVPAGLGSDELTNWLLTFQDMSPSAATHSLERWEKTNALPWLVAAITKADGRQAGLDTLLTAAGRVNQTSPAFPSLAFHRVRLLIEGNRSDDARLALDKILSGDRSRLPASALNQLLSQRMMLAQNLDAFLQSAQRAPAGFSDDSDGREIPDDQKDIEATTKGSKLFFDLDSANIFNKAMPVAILKNAALGSILATNLRRDVTQAAFMRAALLDDRESAMSITKLLGETYPETKAFLASYQGATTPDARRFAAAFLSLKFPGLRPYVIAGVGRTTVVNEIDSYRDNYWCAEPPTSMTGGASQGEEEGEDKPKAAPILPPEFLKPSQALAARQAAALQALGTAPNYLCRIAIEWAEKNPTDARAPEALHLAVRSTRYGCTDKETGRWSKAAYDLLHRRYPNTTWAKNTKYWFKG
jgi:hypothetical protein